MIDEIVELILDLAVEIIPNSVWKVLAFLIGIVATAAGVIMFNESMWTGGVLIGVGMFLVVGTVASWIR